MLNLIKTAAIGIVAFASTFANAEVRLQGSGATFPNPIYQRWVTEYQKSHPNVLIDYQSIGSGGGIKAITEKTVDFAGSDAPLSTKELEKVGAPVIHIPTVAGAVVLAYNLPGVDGELKLSGPVVSEIYMGKISKWNDAKIAALNAGVKLPDLAIVPVYRTDGSGTTFVFTNYLATQNDDFKSTIGAGKQVAWPVGQGGKGSEGVAAGVQQSVGSIGYIEMNYAEANKIKFALLQNKAGHFVKASPESVSAAGSGAVVQMKDSLAVNIWNQDGADAYPIAAFTYIIVYKDLKNIEDPAKAKALVDFLKWAVTDGEKFATEMTYAPLATPVQAKALEAIKALAPNVADAK
jgi:phosphate transport system substrate-binding protein